MATHTNTRFASFFIAALITVALNGSVLFVFDQTSKADQADADVVALQTVTVTAKRV